MMEWTAEEENGEIPQQDDIQWLAEDQEEFHDEAQTDAYKDFPLDQETPDEWAIEEDQDCSFL